MMKQMGTGQTKELTTGILMARDNMSEGVGVCIYQARSRKLNIIAQLQTIAGMPVL